MNKTFRTHLIRWRYGALLLAGVALLSTPVYAQQNAQARLDRLENEIETLSRAVFRGESPPNTARNRSADATNQSPGERAALEIRLSDLERDIRDLTGQLEEQTYELCQFRDDIEDRLRDLEVRLTQGRTDRNLATQDDRNQFQPLPGRADTGAIKAERPQNGLSQSERLTVPSPQSSSEEQQTAPSESVATRRQNTQAEMPPQSQTLGQLTQKPDGTVAPQANDPVAVYEAAFTLLKDGSYEKAEDSFKAFLETHPTHRLVPNAKYWLGETFYVRGNYEQAARTFAAAYQEHPEGSKGPDNLLKLALSLEGLDKREDACLTLQQLISAYPDTNGPVIVRAEQEMKRLNCN